MINRTVLFDGERLKITLWENSHGKSINVDDKLTRTNQSENVTDEQVDDIIKALQKINPL